MGAELSIVASRLGRLNREIGDNKLEEVNQQVREAMTQMRETIWAVRSEEATWQDLFNQLQGFADKLEHDDIQFQLASKLANTHLSPQHLLEIYRIGQEALRNAVRHAQADTIIVIADESGFSVSDNGRGTPADQAGSYGLASMRERAKELGATLDIAGQPGIGTTVRLVW
jgi:signal transduction histidine kinase